MQNRFDEAISELEAAVRLNPNMHLAYDTLGFTKALVGRGEEALSHFANAIRLSPRDPMLFIGYFGFGWAQFLLGNDDQAAEMLRKSIALNPGYSPAHLFLTAAYAMQDRNRGSSASRLGRNFRVGECFGQRSFCWAYSLESQECGSLHGLAF
jgi:tetratricopeptide (TPR) repeat protein